MKDLYGKEKGNIISFDHYSNDKDHVTVHDWPSETVVSAGKGLVIVNNGENYSTLFMEVYPPGASFIRGEGLTYQECDDSCWEQYQKALSCINGYSHEWIPKDYKNGAGFCKHCNTFKTHCFTGEELQQYCHICNVGTTYGYANNNDDNITVYWCSKEHAPDWYELPDWLKEIIDE